MEVAEELVRLQELGIKGKLGEADLKVRIERIVLSSDT